MSYARLIFTVAFSSLVLHLFQVSAAAISESDVGFERSMIEIKDDYVIFNVEIESERRCMQGDLDLIRSDYDQDTTPEKRMIMTLEPFTIDEASPNIIKHDLTDVPKLEGFKTSFHIRRSKQPRQFGLYICKDNSGDGYCRNKKAVPLSNMVNLLDRMKNPDFRKRAKQWDKVYFFQSFIVRDDELFILRGDNTDEKRMKRLDEFLVTKFGNTDAARQTAKLTVRQAQAIDSMPLTVKKNDIRINLPQFDESTCKKGSP